MRIFPFALILFLPLLNPSAGLAGPRVGNGGGVWACQEKQGAFRWLQLVDFFEAENEYGLHLAPSAGAGPWEILDQRVAYLKENVPSLASLLHFGPAELKAAVKMVPARGSLTRIDDDAIRVRPNPATCAGGVLFYGQLANFTPDGRLLIADDIWSDLAFGVPAQAGLLLHELIYKALRDQYGDQTSSRARALVGIAFSRLSAAEKEARAGAILKDGTEQNGSVVLKAPYQTFCEAHIEYEGKASGEPQSVRWEIGSGTLEGHALGGFHFQTTAETGSVNPAELVIVELATGARALVRRNVAAPAFARDGRVGVSFESGSSGAVATLACFAVGR